MNLQLHRDLIRLKWQFLAMQAQLFLKIKMAEYWCKDSTWIMKTLYIKLFLKISNNWLKAKAKVHLLLLMDLNFSKIRLVKIFDQVNPNKMNFKSKKS